jgi:hypothetical protein
MAQGVNGGLQRVSPGVYRNAQGQLVNSKGGSLPGQQQQRPQQMPNRFNDISSMLGGAPGQQPQTPYLRIDPQQAPHFRMPAPYQPGQDNMMWMGGSPNFNELTGQYNPDLVAITQASQAAQQQMGQPQYNPQMQFPSGLGAPQMSSNQQAFNQQQAAGNSLSRMMPNGRMVY